jgi:hypothetical protein
MIAMSAALLIQLPSWLILSTMNLGAAQLL